MNNLIPTHKDNEGNILVNGRDLHEFLEATERYSTWFNRMLKYGFTKNADFTSAKTFMVVNNGAHKEIENHAINT